MKQLKKIGFMKSKHTKKLTFQKKTVTELTSYELDTIKGGTATTFIGTGTIITIINFSKNTLCTSDAAK